LEGRILAVDYGFLHARRAYYYLGGFDPEAAKVSPGTLVVAHAIEEAIREGACEFDFLRGQEPYKYKWGAHDRPCFRRVIRREARLEDVA
jgi:CelD/BcsL family acetyltransferase involved in cellulose biosynthesis